MTDRRHNIAALAGVQVLRFAAGIAVSVLLARALGLTQYGLYATVATIAHLVGFTANAGIHQLLPRAIARAPEGEHGAWVHAGLRGTLVGSLLAAALVSAWAGLFRPQILGAAVVAGVALGAMSLVNIYMAAFEGKRRMALQLPGVLAGRVAFVVATLGALWLSADLAGVFAAQLVGWMVTLAVFAVTLRPLLPRPTLHIPTTTMLASALPFAGYVAFAALQERVDVLVIDALRGSTEVGIYSGATVFLINLPVLARVLSTAAYPRMAASVAAGEVWQPQLHRIVRLLGALGLALAVGGTLVGPALLVDLLGAPYAASGPVLALGAWMMPVVFVRIGLSLALLATDRERARFVGMVLASVLNIALNVALVPSYGAMGAIAATLGSEVALLALYARPLRRDVGPALPALLARAVPPAAVMALILWALPGDPWLIATLGVGAWAVTGRVTGAWTHEDVAVLRRL